MAGTGRDRHAPHGLSCVVSHLNRVVPMICLNWLPFDANPTGAKRRAIELHARLPHRRFLVFVTADFPDADRRRLPHGTFRDVGPRRSLAVRLREMRSRWWARQLEGTGARLWVSDTLPVAYLGGTATVFTLHDLRHLEDPSYVTRRYGLLSRFYMDTALRRADRIIAVSDWGADELAARCAVPRARIRVVPNGVEVDHGGSVEVDHGEPDVGRAPVEPPYLLVVGHLEPRKSIACSIRALARIAEAWPGRLVLVGRDLGERGALEELAVALGVRDRVVFAGAVSDAMLARYYRNSEAVLCPSAYEGFGMTLLEAFAHDRPVVASAIGPHREVAGDAALWFEPADSEALAGCLRQLLAAPGRHADLIAAGRRRIALFSWDTAAARLDDVYEELLARPHS